ncbi:MAG: transporter transrane protein [Firmicutes bacterium]|nr:transporter transrane protein [Bacillota bacterium]
MMNETVEYPKFRWVVLLSIGVALLCTGMNTQSFAPLMGDVAKSLGVDLGTASLGLMGFGMLAMAILVIPAGHLMDRFGIFRVMLVSIFIQVITHALLPFAAKSYETLVILRIVESIAVAPCFIVTGPVAAIWFPRNEIGIANGIMVSMLQLGTMVGLVAGPMLAETMGSWEIGLALLGIVSFVAFVIALVADIQSKKHQPPAIIPTGDQEQSSNKTFLRNPLFWFALIANALSMWVTMAFADLMPAYLAVLPPVGVGMGAITAGKLMSVVTLSTMVFSLVGGFIIDKVFNGNSRRVILIGWVVGAIAFPAIMFPVVHSNYPVLILFLAFAGLLQAFVGPALMGFGAKTFSPTVIGKVIGIWMLSGGIISAVGVSVGSIALRSTGNYSLSMVIMVGLAILGFIITLFLRQRKNDATCKADVAV